MMRNNSEEPIVIVSACDDNYAMPITVTMCSVIANLKTSRSVQIFIIDGGIKENNKKNILKSLNSKNIKVEWLHPKKAQVANLLESGHITITAYYRLLIPELLPQFHKAIYLDSDLIVKGNLEELWNINIEDNYLLAVQDTEIRYVSSAKGIKNYQQLGLSPDCKYFNSGVLVLNLDKWRTNNISYKIIEYIENNKEFIRWHDQDGLNAVLAGKWGELDLKWNQMPILYSYTSWQESHLEQEVYHDLLHNPYIVHFATCGKPWLLGCKHPHKDLFFQYVDMTAWCGWRLTLPRRLQLKLKQEMTMMKKSLLKPQKTAALN